MSANPPKVEELPVEIFKWVGALGHKFVVIERDDGPHGRLYNGWRCCAEVNDLERALLSCKPGQRVFEKVITRVNGVRQVAWLDRTPKGGAK